MPSKSSKNHLKMKKTNRCINNNNKKKKNNFESPLNRSKIFEKSNNYKKADLHLKDTQRLKKTIKLNNGVDFRRKKRLRLKQNNSTNKQNLNHMMSK